MTQLHRLAFFGLAQFMERRPWLVGDRANIGMSSLRFAPSQK